MKLFRYSICALAAVAAPLGAQEGVLEAPALPPASYEGETVGPEVTIIERDDATIYEYRINGQVYMVRVQPVAGPPYYLVDSDGDGQLDVRDNRAWNNSINQWLLFEW